MTDRKKLVVKIGTSTLIDERNNVDAAYLEALATQISALRDEGWDTVIVTSGAIGCGLEQLGIAERPSDIPSLQAAASVGQTVLTNAYAQALDVRGILSSLVLLTRRDTADRGAYLHARDTFRRLLDYGVVPVVNENDTVSVEQIRFGDNDTLAALVSCLVEADLCVILSDIEGLYDAPPHVSPQAQLIPLVERIDQDIMAVAGDAGSTVGSGGMISKIRAARVLMVAGIPLVVCDGRRKNVLADVVRGQDIGTRFAAHEQPHEITPKKLWLALGDAARGAVVVDAGARDALVRKGSSLLCVGVSRVEGRFDPDDIIDVKDDAGIVIARGKVSVASDAIELACGLTREEVEKNRLLANLAEGPIIHRDELVVFE